MLDRSFDITYLNPEYREIIEEDGIMKDEFLLEFRSYYSTVFKKDILGRENNYLLGDKSIRSSKDQRSDPRALYQDFKLQNTCIRLISSKKIELNLGVNCFDISYLNFLIDLNSNGMVLEDEEGVDSATVELVYIDFKSNILVFSCKNGAKKQLFCIRLDKYEELRKTLEGTEE